MKQTVTVSKRFSNLSSKIKICGIYQQGNTLIVVSQILPTGNTGKSVYTCDDSMVVETNSDHKLPVKKVMIQNGKTLDSIKEIKGLQPLQQVAGLASNLGMFVNSLTSSASLKPFFLGEELEPSEEYRNKKLKCNTEENYRLKHNDKDPPKEKCTLPLEDLGDEREWIDEHRWRISQ